MGVEWTPNKSQHAKLTLEKKILPPLLPGFEICNLLITSPALYQQAIMRQCVFLIMSAHYCMHVCVSMHAYICACVHVLCVVVFCCSFYPGSEMKHRYTSEAKQC